VTHRTLTLKAKVETEMILSASDAVNYLSGYGSVRDGVLSLLSVRDVASEPVVELVFEVSHEGSTRIVKLELRDVKEFDYSFTSEDRSPVIEFVKCLITQDGDFYLSLDPYDEREAFVSSNDNEIFRSGRVKLIVETINSGR
jgi:hypothetical protein